MAFSCFFFFTHQDSRQKGATNWQVKRHVRRAILGQYLPDSAHLPDPGGRATKTYWRLLQGWGHTMLPLSEANLSLSLLALQSHYLCLQLPNVTCSQLSFMQQIILLGEIVFTLRDTATQFLTVKTSK